MAKKNFKAGLESLIHETNRKKKENEEEDSLTLQGELSLEEKIEWLKIRLEQQETELHKWRTGKLNATNFEESLKKFNLRYNPETNEFENL